MVCRLTNGQAPVEFMWRIENSVTGANALSINWTTPTWVQLVMFTVNIEPSIPITSEQIILWKDHTGTAYDVVLRAIDPSTTDANIKDWVCNEIFTFEPGEHIRLDYPNSDAQNIGAELYIRRIMQ